MSKYKIRMRLNSHKASWLEMRFHNAARTIVLQHVQKVVLLELLVSHNLNKSCC